jgi:hypothetical protein
LPTVKVAAPTSTSYWQHCPPPEDQEKGYTMGCLVALMAGLFPRLALFIVWLARPARIDAAFDTFLLPLLGIIFLPFATLMYVLLYTPGAASPAGTGSGSCSPPSSTSATGAPAPPSATRSRAGAPRQPEDQNGYAGADAGRPLPASGRHRPLDVVVVDLFPVAVLVVIIQVT